MGLYASATHLVDEKEDLVAKSRAVGLAQEFVELLVELYIIVRVDAENTVAAVGLIDVVDVVELFRAKAPQDKIAYIMDGGSLEDATQVHHDVEPARSLPLEDALKNGKQQGERQQRTNTHARPSAGLSRPR